MKPTSIASSNPVQIQDGSNRESEKQIGASPVWSRRNAPSSSPVVAAPPKPHGQNLIAKHEPGSHRAVSSTLQHRPQSQSQSQSISHVSTHAADPAEAPVSNSPVAGNRVVNAFSATKDDVVGGFKNNPIRNLLNPTRAVVATIGTFIYYLFRPAK